MDGPRSSGGRSSDGYSNLFISAKSGARRPELHKPHLVSNPLSSLHKPPASGNPLSQVSAPLPRFEHKGFRDPTSKPQSKPIRRIEDSDDEDDDVFEIAKPADFPTWQPKPFKHPTFSSAQTTNPYFQPKEAIMISSKTSTTSTTNNIWDDRYDASDPNIYLDSGRANDELKALFEGGIEDEEEGSIRRKRKPKADSKIEDLSDQLQSLDVKPDSTETADEQEEDEDDGVVEGLKVKLLPHQVEGVEWMRIKECGSDKKRKGMTSGGILADDMGLGKTIQSIALILINRPPAAGTEETTSQETKYDKCTLIVAPLALIKQWETEIKERVESDHAFKICIHHGPQRAKSYKELRKYDIVITTYQTLSSEHGASNDKIRAGCYGINWYRVILDEAHSIKNRNAKVTKAACALEARYRWCLTGTPMQNNLDELQSLIHFLRIGPLDKLDYWRERITQPMNGGRGGLAIRRLQTVLKSLMKRRTKDVLKQAGALKSGSSETSDTKTGDSGFKLVKRTVEKIEAVFSPEERSFYTRLESRIDENIEKMMANNNKVSYASALVLLLRLRQACNHTKLLGFDLASERDALGDGNQTPRRKVGQTADGMDDLTAMFGGLDVEMRRCDICQAELSQVEIKDAKLRCQDCEDDLNDQINAGKDKQRRREDTKAIIKNDRKISRKIIVDSDDEEEENTDEHSNNDNDRSTKLVSKVVHLDDTSDDESDRTQGEDEEDGEDEDEDSEDSEYSSDGSQAATLITSTKIRHLVSILRADSHTHKYIVFSFFTSMLNLIEPFLRQHHIKFTRYDGSMRNDLREASLHSLRNDPTTRVLLCSLRAGSLGLNLTAASRVVILEPFWNPFVEEQAIDRVHRLNQTQDIVVYKLTIKDTVEARILELQERKRELARMTVEGGSTKGLAKLTLAEMMKLFDHSVEHDAMVDMLGMKDGKSLLDRDRGESTRDPDDELDSYALYRGGPTRKGTGLGGPSNKPKKREHEVYGRRW